MDGSPRGLWGDLRDSFDQSIYAHSSPVYFSCGTPPPPRREESARYFLNGIDDSLKWIDTWGRYNTDRQREDVRELFPPRAGRLRGAGRGKIKMNCIHCHGKMQRSKAPFHVDRNGYHLVIDTVPALGMRSMR